MSTIDQYREARTSYQGLLGLAKKELIKRADEISSEWLAIQQELKEDFGHKLTFPRAARNGARKPKKAAAPELVSAPPPTNVTNIEKKIAAQRKKLEDVKASGKPTKPVEDRIYELEDELRLAKSA
jgi:hypothetical protein